MGKWAIGIKLTILVGISAILLQGGVLESDSLALVDLFNMDDSLVGGDVDWDLTAPISSWSGIQTVGDRVTSISLSGKGLTGPIPASLYSLDSLVTLGLSSNQLSGELSDSVWNFSNINTISLWDNNFSGPLPEVTVAGLPLKILYLKDNHFSGPVPETFGLLTNLTNIDLGNNELTGDLPTSLNNWNKSYIIRFDGNQLTGSISEGFISASLIILDLSGNQFTGQIPTSICYSNLLELRMHHNQFSGEIPAAISNMTDLKILDLGYNQLGGNIPEDIDELHNLNELSIRDNLFTDLPDLSGFENRTSEYAFILRLDNNYFEFDDIIPITEINFSTGTNLSYRDQKVFGTADTLRKNYDDEMIIKTQASHYPGNVYTWYQNDKLMSEYYGETDSVIVFPYSDYGIIGEWALKVTNPAVPYTTLEYSPIEIIIDGFESSREADSTILVMLYDSLGGAEWTTPWNLSDPMDTWNGLYFTNNGRVRYMNLNNNNLIGTLPSSFWRLNEISTLHMNSNEHLKGCISPEIKNMKLYDFGMSCDSLSGTLPKELGELDRVRIMRLNNNNFCDTIPRELGNCSALENLYLEYNNLSGAVPDEIANMPSLVDLALANNEIDGIPNFTGAPVLNELYLDNNHLDFGDLEPSAFKFQSMGTASYQNQANIGFPVDTLLEFGTSYSFTPAVTGQANSYVWSRNGQPVPAQNTATLSLANVDLSNYGIWKLAVTNPLLPDLVLNSEPVKLRLDTGSEPLTPNLKDVKIDMDYITFSWTPLSYPYFSHTHLYVSSTAGIDTSTAFYYSYAAGDSTITYRCRDLGTWTELWIAMTSTDMVGNMSPLSPEVKISNIDNTAPKMPGELSVTSENSQLRVSWPPNQETDLSHYFVYYTVNSDAGSGLIEWGATTVANPLDTTAVITGLTNGSDVTVYVTAIDIAGNESEMRSCENVTVSIDPWAGIPESFSLNANYPNPFNPVTTLRYGIPEQADVLITVFDVLGHDVKHWTVSAQKAGWYAIIWDGTNQSGKRVSTGVYVCRMQATSMTSGQPYIQTRKMLFLK